MIPVYRTASPILNTSSPFESMMRTSFSVLSHMSVTWCPTVFSFDLVNQNLAMQTMYLHFFDAMPWVSFSGMVTSRLFSYLDTQKGEFPSSSVGHPLTVWLFVLRRVFKRKLVFIAVWVSLKRLSGTLCPKQYESFVSFCASFMSTSTLCALLVPDTHVTCGHCFSNSENGSCVWYIDMHNSSASLSGYVFSILSTCIFSACSTATMAIDSVFV